jgi:hypothetical protein
MTAKPSGAAERMRTYRARRRNGLRWASVLLHETDIQALVRKGFLEREHSHDPDHIGYAMDSFIRSTLGTAGDA